MPHGVQEADLTFASLEELDDGRIGKLLKRHFANVSNDCMNRPTDPAKRKVIVEFAFSPVYDAELRECEVVKVTIEAKSKVPTFRSKKYEMRPHKSGFAFNQDFPDKHDQQPLPFGESDGTADEPPSKPR